DLRYRVVKRLEELEAQSVPQLPNFADPAAAARAWADEVEQKKALALETMNALIKYLSPTHALHPRCVEQTLSGVRYGPSLP
ncbi:MAG: hypothetical protein OIF55_05105, partial [Amphritea sp.]|nr:hypothetical protein [Amphritea sp.]